MTTIVITGGAGFVGSHLVRRLVRAGDAVIVLARPHSDLWRIQDLSDRIKIIQVELGTQNLARHLKELEAVEAIYHLAATGLLPAASQTLPIIQTNVLGTLELLNLAVQLKVKRFVYCGSCFEYPSGERWSEEQCPFPISEYAASKSAGWLLTTAFHQRYQLPAVTLRTFTAYGPYEAKWRLVPHTITKALEGLPIDLTGGEQSRDFIFIDDLIEAFCIAGDAANAVGETFNICTGVATPVKEVAQTIVEKTGAKVPIQFGARSDREGEIWKLSGNPAKAKTQLSWSAKVSLSEGLDRTIQWFRENRTRYFHYR